MRIPLFLSAMALAVILDAIANAARSGDVAALEENFNDARVRAAVDAVEAIITVNPSFDSDENESPTWVDLKFYEIAGWLDGAVASGHVEVLEWFFAPARRAFMGSTLPHLLAWSMNSTMSHDKPDILEFLLESSSCSELHSDEDKQELFDNVTRSWRREASDGVLQVLLAHGLDVTRVDQLKMACAETLSPSQVDLVVREGVGFVDSGVLSCLTVDELKNYAGIQRLIHHGANGSRVAFEAAMAYTDFDDDWWEIDHQVARILLEDGFVDVDEAFGPSGRTPLMTVVANSFNVCGEAVGKPTPILQMLLDYGADVSKRDGAGRTVLHYVRDNAEVASVLLANGADPNVRCPEGWLGIDILYNDPWYAYGGRRLAVTSLSLQYGLDPSALGSRGQATLEQLQEKIESEQNGETSETV